jgi:hypothetical protein
VIVEVDGIGLREAAASSAAASFRRCRLLRGTRRRMKNEDQRGQADGSGEGSVEHKCLLMWGGLSAGSGKDAG